MNSTRAISCETTHTLHELLSCVNHLEKLIEAGFYIMQPNEEFVFREGRNNMWIRSVQCGHTSGASARCAIIGGPKVEIINLMIFPKQSEVPVFASEIILLGSKIHVAVVDHQAVKHNSAILFEIGRILLPLHRKYSAVLTGGGGLPDWAKEHFTPWCIYTRPSGASETPTVCESFCEYLNIWLEHWLPRLNSYDQDHSLVNQYLNHHLVNTPGRLFLGKGFGVDWAESYLHEFMYAPLESGHPQKAVHL